MAKQDLEYNKLEKTENFKLVEVTIKDISQVSVEAWAIELHNKDLGKSIHIIADIGQTTSVLFGLSKTSNLSLSPSIYQFTKTLCNYNNSKVKSIIIDYVDGSISKSKLEIENKNGLVYFDVSSGDALALATINEIPIYTMVNLLKENEDGDEIEIDLE